MKNLNERDKDAKCDRIFHVKSPWTVRLTLINTAKIDHDRRKSLPYKWKITDCPVYSCGIEQTIQFAIEMCLNTKFKGRIERLQSAYNRD